MIPSYIQVLARTFRRFAHVLNEHLFFSQSIGKAYYGENSVLDCVLGAIYMNEPAYGDEVRFEDALDGFKGLREKTRLAIVCLHVLLGTGTKIWSLNFAKYGKYSLAKFANFLYICIT